MRKGRNPRPAKVARLALLGPPPLITGEDADAYDELLARVSAGVEPKDLLEEIWVRDIVDLEWEIMRMRRMKAGLFTAKAYQSLQVVLRPLTDEDMQKYDSEREPAQPRIKSLQFAKSADVQPNIGDAKIEEIPLH